MRHIFLFFCAWVTTLGAMGQNPDWHQEVVAPSGDVFTNSNTELSWTLGELAIATYSPSSGFLTQGFHQTNLIATGIAQALPGYTLRVFPNPVQDVVQVELIGHQVGMRLSLLDQQGRRIQEISSPGSKEARCQMKDLPPGIYLLRVHTMEGDLIQAFKILKNL